MDRKYNTGFAMTGEISLNGKVMKIGGLREKVLAAKREGIMNIICPRSNENDVKEFKDYIKDKMTFYFVSKLLRIITEVRDGDAALGMLSPYHLQTMFFYEVDRVQRQRDWKEGKMASRFVDFLRAISKHLECGVCTNYFMNPPDYETINLFDNLRLEDMQAMKKTIDSYIENPLECLRM